MGKKYSVKVSAKLICFLLAAIGFVGLDGVAQTLNDGPINLQVRVREVRANHSDNDGLAFINLDAEFRMRIWAEDNANVDGVGWGAGSMLQQNNMGFPNTTNDFNQNIFNFTYGVTVPQYFDIRIDAWEDDCPFDIVIGGQNCGTSTTLFDGGCCIAGTNCSPWSFPGNLLGCTAYNDDDEHCNSNPFQTAIDYRLGPPCQWYNHGFISNATTCPGNKYEPRIESFWRYTRGNGCANAINLGGVSPGFSTITHFNSTECYSNTMTASPGNDVTYEFFVSVPTGVTISLCSAGAFTGNVLYLMNSSCSQINTNIGACGANAEIDEPLCQTGTYYVVVDGQAAANMGTFTLTISENPTVLPAAEAGPNVAICEGTNTQIGAVSPLSTASNGVPPYTISWSPNYNISSTTAPNPTVAPLFSTTYTVTVTDGNGCTVQDTVRVTVNPGTPMTLGPDFQFCPGATATLSINPPVFLQHYWSNGASGPTANSITTTVPGTYNVTAIDLNGCVTRDTINISYYPDPGLEIGNDTSICQGNSLLLNATVSGSASYLWNTGATTPTLSVSTAGQYSVIVNTGACDWYDTINVSIDTLPIISIGPNQAICQGTTTILDPGPGYPSYLWSDGSNNQTLTVTMPGTYSVTVTNTNGCQGSASMYLSNLANPQPNLGPDVDLCLGTSTLLNAGPGFASYQWFSGQTTQQITVSAPGTYAVTVSDGNGCLGSDTIQVNPLIPTPLDLGNDTTLCAGGTISLTAPAGFSSYVWSTGTIAQTTTVNTPGYVYCTVTDANGCSNVDSLMVNSVPSPTPFLGNDTTVCPGETVTLDGGTGYVSYAWSNGASGQIINVTNPATYTVTVTNAYGCTGTDDLLVSNYPGTTVSLGPDQNLCDGNSVNITTGGGFAGYIWSNGATTPDITVSAGGTYSVTVTDADGCMDQDTIVITLDPSPIVDLGDDTTLCFVGGQITLDAGNPGANYAWSTGDNSQTILVNTAGTYSVTVTNGFSCAVSDTIDVNIAAPINVSLGNDTTICDSGFVLLNAGPNVAGYSWSGPGGFTSNNQLVFADQTGTYSVTVTDAFGCQGFDDIQVTATSLVNTNLLGQDTTGCEGVPVLLDPGDQYLYYQWDNGSPNQYFFVDSTGTYAVEVEDMDGCRYRDEIFVNVETFPRLVLVGPGYICPQEPEMLDAGSGFTGYLWNTGETTQQITITQPGVYSVTASYNACEQYADWEVTDDCAGRIFVPNVFSPNNDGLNDQFELVAVKLEDFEIWIYDRWGKFLFNSSDINNSWDGRAKSGKDVPEGVYYYRIRYKFFDNENVLEKAGNVTVLR